MSEKKENFGGKTITMVLIIQIIFLSNWYVY